MMTDIDSIEFFGKSGMIKTKMKGEKQ